MKQVITYRNSEIKAGLRAAGVSPGAVCIVHSSLMHLGWPEDGTNPAQVWLKQMQEYLGPDGVLILPAFTYSYCRHQVYDPRTDLCSVSLLANYAIS